MRTAGNFVLCVPCICCNEASYRPLCMLCEACAFNSMFDQ
jgi:hypothetical protein